MTLAIDREAEPLLRVNGAGRDFAGRGWGASGIFRAVDDVNLQVWRGETLGSYFLVFNAILNFDQLGAGRTLDPK